MRKPSGRVIIREPLRTGLGLDGTNVKRGEVLKVVEFVSSESAVEETAKAIAKGLAEQGYDVTVVITKEIEEVTIYGVPEEAT